MTMLEPFDWIAARAECKQKDASCCSPRRSTTTRGRECDGRHQNGKYEFPRTKNHTRTGTATDVTAYGPRITGAVKFAVEPRTHGRESNAKKSLSRDHRRLHAQGHGPAVPRLAAPHAPATQPVPRHRSPCRRPAQLPAHPRRVAPLAPRS